MPLSSEEIDNFNEIFTELDNENNGFLTDQNALDLFHRIPTFQNLSEKAISLAVKGLSCHDEIKLSKSILENFYTAIKDQNDLELLRVSLRGLTTPRKPTIDLNQALELSSILGIPKTLGELLSPDENEIKEFSFSYLADVFYGISIPEDSNQFDGISDISQCCYLI